MKGKAQKDESQGVYSWVDKARLTRCAPPGWLSFHRRQLTCVYMFGQLKFIIMRSVKVRVYCAW